MEVFENLQIALLEPFISFSDSLPENYRIILNIFIYVFLISIYSIFVFQFYIFLARKNIIALNLSQYNHSEHPFMQKFFAALFFLIEYIIILPVLVFFWFAILSLLLLLLSKDQSVSQILLISAGVVGAIRATSYFKEELSRDLAKLFPFTVLTIFLLSSNFLTSVSFIDRISEIPSLLNHILVYLIFITFFEALIRAVYTIAFLFKKPQEQEAEELEEEIKEKG